MKVEFCLCDRHALRNHCKSIACFRNPTRERDVAPLTWVANMWTPRLVGPHVSNRTLPCATAEDPGQGGVGLSTLSLQCLTASIIP
jgi:hypothetical protein